MMMTMETTFSGVNFFVEQFAFSCHVYMCVLSKTFTLINTYCPNSVITQNTLKAEWEKSVTETHFHRLWQLTAVGTKSCGWCRGIKNWCSWQKKTSQLQGAEWKGPHEKLRTIWNAAWSETWVGVRVSEQEGKSSESLSRCVCQCCFMCWHKRPWV